ncbi:MAG: adenylate/guanylate cyclase domain-containing protein [Bdellovibrionales bacterium]|nr:adenylate/guanylate cyclase domain-containing protein [Bdellovibrionales bacterium]
MKKALLALCIALFAAGAHLFFYPTAWVQRLEMLALDLWFNVRGTQATPGNVLLIAMDESSYAELGLSMNKAWPRAVHAKLLERLAAAGVSQVVFDVAFIGPSADPAGDDALTYSLSLLPSAIGVDDGTVPGQPGVVKVFLPYEPFQESVSTLALVGLPLDSGQARRFKTARSELTESFPTLAEAGAGFTAPYRDGPSQRDLIWFYGPSGTIPTYPYYQALDPQQLPDEALRGKVVYVGLALRTDIGPAQKDAFLTSFWTRGTTFGVEIHATAAENLLNHTWIKRKSETEEQWYLGLAAFGFAGIFSLLPPTLSAAALGFALLSWAIIAFSAFQSHLFVPGLFLVSIVLPVVYLVATLFYYFITVRKQKKTEKAFSLYLSPEMARRVASGTGALQLGGENVEATAIFTDIVDFTKLSEQLPAEQVVRMLNRYFTEVMDVVFQKQGTLIKYIGDSIFAIWGAPVKLDNHASLALETAVSIRNNVKIFNESERFPRLDTRIGVHTGNMVVGNLGSEKRFDYTAIGDSVNLASRIEGLNKYLGTTLLITEDCVAEAETDHELIEIGVVRVVGKQRSVKVFTVPATPLSREELTQWNDCLNAFQAKEFQRAMASFQSFIDSDHELSKTAQFYLNQMQTYPADSLPENWAGEVQFDSK